MTLTFATGKFRAPRTTKQSAPATVGATPSSRTQICPDCERLTTHTPSVDPRSVTLVTTLATSVPALAYALAISENHFKIDLVVMRGHQQRGSHGEAGRRDRCRVGGYRGGGSRGSDVGDRHPDRLGRTPE